MRDDTKRSNDPGLRESLSALVAGVRGDRSSEDDSFQAVTDIDAVFDELISMKVIDWVKMDEIRDRSGATWTISVSVTDDSGHRSMVGRGRDRDDALWDVLERLSTFEIDSTKSLETLRSAWPNPLSTLKFCPVDGECLAEWLDHDDDVQMTWADSPRALMRSLRSLGVLPMTSDV